VAVAARKQADEQVETKMFWIAAIGFTAFLGYQLLGTVREVSKASRYANRQRKAWDIE
jgi:uncharacterized protein with PQ loop repeat